MSNKIAKNFGIIKLVRTGNKTNPYSPVQTIPIIKQPKNLYIHPFLYIQTIPIIFKLSLFIHIYKVISQFSRSSIISAR